MADVINLAAFKTVKEWQAFAVKQQELIQNLMSENQFLKRSVKDLEDILKSQPEVITSLSIASNEEELCKMEINRLYEAGKIRALELQEVKIFEIYVKSLLAIKGKTIPDATKKEASSKLPRDQVLALAKQITENDEIN